MVAVLVPNRGVTKLNFASWRQCRLADTKPFQLPPIKQWSINIADDDWNVCCALTIKNAHRNLSSYLTVQSRPCKKAAGSAKSKPYLRVDDNRPIGCRGNGRKRGLWRAVQLLYRLHMPW